MLISVNNYTQKSNGSRLHGPLSSCGSFKHQTCGFQTPSPLAKAKVIAAPENLVLGQVDWAGQEASERSGLGNEIDTNTCLRLFLLSRTKTSVGRPSKSLQLSLTLKSKPSIAPVHTTDLPHQHLVHLERNL